LADESDDVTSKVYKWWYGRFTISHGSSANNKPQWTSKKQLFSGSV
jgi:hypothetical protein